MDKLSLCARRAREWLLALVWLGAMLFVDSAAWASESLCAEVKLEIKQKISLERQAFDAVLRIVNGLDGIAVENVGINVTFLDSSGTPVPASFDPNNTSARFFLQLDNLDQLTAVDGTGTVAAKSTGEARWLIIPAATAGGSTPSGTQYKVGATVSYRLGNDVNTIEVAPVTITVRPQPRLALDYFLPEEVYADDPFTPAMEPAEPAALGVRVRNTGYGIAKNVTINSAQARIAENVQGLQIAFELLGSYIDNLPASPTLLLNLGDIPAGGARTGRWNLVTTLSGHFTEFSASYTHADTLGGALTSLLESIDTHLLLHDVLVDLPGRDNVRDFLALDIDVVRVYESNGVDAEITDLSAQGSLTSLPGPNGAYQLQVPGTALPFYAHMADPTAGGIASIAALRGDGTSHPSANVWLSKSRLPDGGWVHFINFFDTANHGPYTLNAVLASPPSTLQGSVFADLDGDGVRNATENGLANVEITLSGETAEGNPVTETAQTDVDGVFHFEEVAAGTYALAVAPAVGLLNGVHSAGTAGGNVQSDAITGIVLPVGTEASGYVFAKIPPPEADLAISITLPASVPEAGESFQFSITASNAGSDAAAIPVAQLDLPAGLTLLDATPASGNFDPALAQWTINGLAAATSVSLQITAISDSSGTHTVGASISESASLGSIDPIPANNAAQAEIVVEAVNALTLAFNPTREARVLVLVGCADAGQSATAECVSQRAQTIAGLLNARGVTYQLADSAAAFASAFHQGDWNMYWLSGSASQISSSLAQELREAVFASDALLVDAGLMSTDPALRELVGGYQSSLPAEANVAFSVAASSGLTAGTFTTVGAIHALENETGTVLASFENVPARPALIEHPFGYGRVLTAAFELPANMVGDNAHAALFTTLLDRITPIPQETYPAGSYLPLAAIVPGSIVPASIQLGFLTGGGAQFIVSSPQPTITSTQELQWQRPLSASEVFIATAGLRLGETTQPVSIAATLNKTDNATPELLGAQTITVWVQSFDDLLTDATAALSALNLSDSAELKAKSDALTALQTVTGPATPLDTLTVRGQLLTAAIRTASISSVTVAEIRRAIDGALKIEWRKPLPVQPQCAIGAAAPVAFDGTGFVAFSESEGLQAQGGEPDDSDWEWALGTDLGLSGTARTENHFTWISDKTYAWTFTINRLGVAALTVLDEGQTALESTFTSNTGGSGMQVGNALRLQVNVGDGLNNVSVTADVNQLNGQPAAAGAAVKTSGAAAAAAAWLLHGSGNGSLSVSGTLRLNFPGSTPPSGSGITMTLVAGNAACQP